jgi:outer membrane lipoprotein-sorting protein
MIAVRGQIQLKWPKWLCCMAGLALAGWVATAGAYVLEGPYVLALMVKKLQGPHTLHVQQQVVVEDPLVSPQSVILAENLYYSYPDRFRSETLYNNTQRILVSTPEQVLTVVDNVIASNQEGRFDAYKDLLLYLTRDLLHKALSMHGVDVGVTSLGHWGDQVAWVIGARYPDDSVSQVWVDKESLLPVRWITILAGPSPTQPPERLEFIYRNWEKQGGAWYPHQIETYHNQQRIRMTRVKQIQSNVTLPAELFDIAHLMTIYQPADAQTQEQTGHTQMDEVERTIDSFKKKFEP